MSEGEKEALQSGSCSCCFPSIKEMFTRPLAKEMEDFLPQKKGKETAG